jgi:hypothetical protein
MLWERATCKTTDVFAPVEKCTSGGGMLNLEPSTYLRLWEWREDKVNLIGATQAITVRIRYEKVLPLLTLGTDPVQIRSATDPLGFATAALAARSCGARAGAGFARHRADGHRESDRALRPTGTDQGPPPHAPQRSPPHRVFVEIRVVVFLFVGAVATVSHESQVAAGIAYVECGGRCVARSDFAERECLPAARKDLRSEDVSYIRSNFKVALAVA